MSTARILIKHGDVRYRLLKVEAASDGSLICLLDKDPQPLKGGIRVETGKLIAEADLEKPVPYGRFSIHTTGEIHRYSGGQRKDTIHIEPLHQLTKAHAVGYFSIPTPERLDTYDASKHTADVVETLEIPTEVSERLTFLLEIGPKALKVATYGIGLSYELYTLVSRSAAARLPEELAASFVEAAALTVFDSRQIQKDEAELRFYQKIYGQGSFVFRENGGAYVALTSVPMARAPTMRVEFDGSELSIETIPFDAQNKPTHKVRFWIRDKGGRNKQHDLREHIRSVVFDARL
ncbi:hypothetical protein IVB40_32595 [Bradyrhizobium sp. 40]|uniref:hypothetical protein n=1 Tax=Bradyrhizobium sp. 40 TaxID=2782674 RepID=UPI001FFF1793|nr:hypothetical protein [Bradyrhizobium sp. 40]UPJ41964.1 hypothetical protein IVB40_32595 [Bradyrhizobium sp. 40]